MQGSQGTPAVNSHPDFLIGGGAGAEASLLVFVEGDAGGGFFPSEIPPLWLRCSQGADPLAEKSPPDPAVKFVVPPFGAGCGAFDPIAVTPECGQTQHRVSGFATPSWAAVALVPTPV